MNLPPREILESRRVLKETRENLERLKRVIAELRDVREQLSVNNRIAKFLVPQDRDDSPDEDEDN